MACWYRAASGWAAVDGSGNVYLAGFTEGELPGQTSEGGYDGFLRKYSPGGKHLWTRQFGTDRDDEARAMAVDGSGAAYVAGYTDGALTAKDPKGGYDAYLRKYSPGGRTIWTRQFGTDAHDEGSAVAVDGSGDVYLAGFTYGELPKQIRADEYDAFLRKYSTGGRPLWTRQFGTDESDLAYAVAVYRSRSAYVAGYTYGELPGETSAGGQDAYLRKHRGS